MKINRKHKDNGVTLKVATKQGSEKNGVGKVECCVRDEAFAKHEISITQ